MRQLIESAVQVFRSNPDLEADEILSRIVGRGVERRVAVQLVVLLPLAYGRVLLSDSGVLFPDTYLWLGKPGKGRLSALPLWAEAIGFARRDGEPFFPIASRSPEVRAANRALQDGKELRTLVWGPPAFLWPIEPIPGLEGGAKKPSWWRQIWDAPAVHSMTRRERTAARIMMALGLLIGLLAVGAAAYYLILLLQEFR